MKLLIVFLLSIIRKLLLAVCSWVLVFLLLFHHSLTFVSLQGWNVRVFTDKPKLWTAKINHWSNQRNVTSTFCSEKGSVVWLQWLGRNVDTILQWRFRSERFCVTWNGSLLHVLNLWGSHFFCVAADLLLWLTSYLTCVLITCADTDRRKNRLAHFYMYDETLL